MLMTVSIITYPSDRTICGTIHNNTDVAVRWVENLYSNVRADRKRGYQRTREGSRRRTAKGTFLGGK
jgi:hypothetical protein